MSGEKGHNEDHKITIIVNQKPHHVYQDVISAAEIRHLAPAPDDYEVWKIIKDPDPEGQLPLDDIQITESVHIKSGDRFRVVPPGTFGSIPIQLVGEIEYLKQEGINVEIIEQDSLAYVIFNDYKLPHGFNKLSTKLLLKVPISYPNGNIDMFWTDPNIRLASGTAPANTNEEAVLGQNWLRFSWHPQRWNPGTDNIHTFLEFVNRRLGQSR